jgi:hypothetical protein
MKIYVIKDIKSEGFGTPQFIQTEAIAVRTLKTVVNQEGSNIHLYPEDHHLMEIGEYNSMTGVITPLKEPKLISKAEHHKSQDQKDQLKFPNADNND